MTTATRGRQLNKPATMTTTLNYDPANPSRATIDVEHAPHQSYSRAVQPAANRALMAAMRAGRLPSRQWYNHGPAFAESDKLEAPDGRTITRYAYATTQDV